MTICLTIFLKIVTIYATALMLGGYRELNDCLSHKTRHLVALAKDGDASALNRLCNVYGPRILWRVRLRMGKELRSKLESVDLVQDVLVSAFQDLRGFTYKNEGDFMRWLSRITENRLRDNLDKLHADKRDIGREVRLGMHQPTLEDSFAAAMEPLDATTPSVIVSKREDFDKLTKAIDLLKPEYREVIILAKIDGLSYREIGNRLGKSADAAGHLLLRAMVSLTETFWTI